MNSPNIISKELNESLFNALWSHYWHLKYYWRGNKDIDRDDVYKKFLDDTGVLVDFGPPNPSEFPVTGLLRVIDVDKLVIWRMSQE